MQLISFKKEQCSDIHELFNLGTRRVTGRLVWDGVGARALDFTVPTSRRGKYSVTPDHCI